MPTIHIITYGKNQRPKKPHWWHRHKSVYRIRCDNALRRYSCATETTTGLDECVKQFYDQDSRTTQFLIKTYRKLHDWVRSHSHYELYIYVRSNRGIIRSVYVGSMCKSFLVSLGFHVEIHHMELMRKNLQ